MRSPWLFSAPVDLAAFLGSAVLSLAALAVGARLGLLDGHAPDWSWITAVLLVDVAHVYSTVFRVYLDPAEMARRPLLYQYVPVIGLGAGMMAYSLGPLAFWRTLAYLAVFHFVRQQYGWVALYRARLGERDGRWLDAAAIYAATLYPLLYWHLHMPRAFSWLIEGDFAPLPSSPTVLRLAFALYAAILAAYALRSALAWRRGAGNPGKDVVVATTAVCWYVGMVGFDSDYAFMVTNVFIHGIPYLVLLYAYGRARCRQTGGSGAFRLFRRGPWAWLVLLWAAAFVEELLWDRGVWHDRAWLFGTGWDLEFLHVVLVPLLALPQLVHYILDGFVWRRGANPDFPLPEFRGGYS